jgi:SAM-dependent methyltransferase
MEAADWDDRYATAEYVWKSDPNRLLVEQVAGLTPGRALDLACGEGRNAVWLAEQGWEVTAVDFSRVALDKGRRLASERRVDVEWICADATTWNADEHDRDLVAVLYLQLPAAQRRLALTNAANAMAEGATLIVIAHDTRNLADGTGGPQDPDVLYDPTDVVADLRAAGIDVEVVRAETVERNVEGADRPALDCLVRVTRVGPSGCADSGDVLATLPTKLT